MYKARIKDIYRKEIRQGYAGIKGGGGYYRTPYGYYNGAGGFSSYPERMIILQVWVFRRHKYAYIDIYDDLRDATGRQRITRGYLNQLRENNVGEVVDVYYDWDDDDWYLSNIYDLTL